uniref:Kin17 DNA and RNA binding protein n=1 Tax=Pavo cristatus TaxID=9049 RepID=A0A8C9FHS3_PAVCR
MGKSDFLSPKAIANRIKSKGLQKLRWYCQMCQKQCRDENGFKCHCMSESHQRQLLLASENPQQFLNYFSEEFRNDFLELLRRRFGTKRVHNNIVYNEYISHREHIHMNATQWETLTDFTKWLGREGNYCCSGLWHFKTIGFTSSYCILLSSKSASNSCHLKSINYDRTFLTTTESLKYPSICGDKKGYIVFISVLMKGFKSEICSFVFRGRSRGYVVAQCYVRFKLVSIACVLHDTFMSHRVFEKSL